jgi:hypothetical protein
MEPTKTAYAIYTRVVSVTREEYAVRGRIVDGQAIVDKQDLGWCVLFEGSHEKLFLGWDKPNLAAGDKVKILIEAMQ